MVSQWICYLCNNSNIIMLQQLIIGGPNYPQPLVYIFTPKFTFLRKNIVYVQRNPIYSVTFMAFTIGNTLTETWRGVLL